MKRRNLWMMAIMAGALAFTAGCGGEDKSQDSNSQETAAENEAADAEEETETADAEEEKEPVKEKIYPHTQNPGNDQRHPAHIQAFVKKHFFNFFSGHSYCLKKRQLPVLGNHFVQCRV